MASTNGSAPFVNGSRSMPIEGQMGIDGERLHKNRWISPTVFTQR